ncbi:MAG: hypothetical protein WBQ10_19125 [Terriglobales bacterium]
MSKLSIPEGYRAGVSKIRKLDERSVREIRNALDKATDTSHRPDDVAVDAVSSISHANLDEFKEIAEAVGTLYGVRMSTPGVSVQEFAEDICDAMESVDSDDLRLQKSERPQFKEKLLVLFGSPNFEIVAKAWDLKTDDERVFCGARILTDMRPVFGENVEDGPKAMVIVHLLKLGFDRVGDARRHSEFHVSLDTQDLEVLRALIKRADDKAKALRNTVNSGTPVFGAPKE